MYLFLHLPPSTNTASELSLHSTMYLFLLLSDLENIDFGNLFTFHNVSISTLKALWEDVLLPSLHSTMYLFLLCGITYLILAKNLYIPQCIYFYHINLSELQQIINFTFHNVSISTYYGQYVSIRDNFLYIPQCIYFYLSENTMRFNSILSLHSTMYLFLRRDGAENY